MRWKYFLKNYGWVAVAFLWGCQLLYTYSNESSLSGSSNQKSPVDPINWQPKERSNGGGGVPWNLEDAGQPEAPKVKHKSQGHGGGGNNPWALNEGDEPVGDQEESDVMEGEPIEGRDGNHKVTPFKVIQDSGDLCKDDDIFLAIYVFSSAQNLEKRNAIRQSWGNSKLYDLKVRVVFVMGLPDNNIDISGIKKILSLEMRKYNDIVQEDFLDTTKNVTYKAIAGLNWVQRKCSKAKYVLKTNDNVFLNLPALLKHLWDLSQLDLDEGLLMCRVWWKMHVMRGNDNWAVTMDEYPLQFYPPYCSGSAYVMSADVARRLRTAIRYVPMIWIDDVYITGVLAYHQSLKHTQLIHTFISDSENKCFEQPTWYRCLVMVTGDLDLWGTAWERLLHAAKTYPIPEVQLVSPGLIAGNNDPESLPKVPELTKEEFDKYFNKL